MTPIPRPRLHFSFRSPYSWLAIRRLRQRLPDAFESIDWYPFWDPDAGTEAGLRRAGGEFHYVQMSRAKHFYLLMDTKRLAAAEGLSMAWPVDVVPHWEVPHLGWLVARRAGLHEAFYDEACAARWERGEDICRRPVIAEVAEKAGLDPGPVLGAVLDADVRREGVEALMQAYQDDIFGIPYLRWRRQRFWGIDRLNAFLDAWSADQPGAVVPAGEGQDEGEQTGGPETGLLPVGYDTDTAGGCG